MLEHMAVSEYIAPKSLPLEQMISWKLHNGNCNMVVVPGISSPQLVLASGVHLFIFFLLFLC